MGVLNLGIGGNCVLKTALVRRLSSVTTVMSWHKPV